MFAAVLWTFLYITRTACYDERVFETANLDVEKYSIKRGENITLLCPGVHESLMITDLDWLMVAGKKNIAHYENKTGIITWTKKDDRISLVENFGLNFAMVLATDSGEYICIFNNRNIPEIVMNLIVQDVPDPPGRPLFISFTSRSVKLSWAPSRNTHASPITHYIINTRIGEDTDWIAKEILTPNNRSIYEVKDLLPYTVYSFRIIAVNGMGASVPGRESFYMVTLREIPTGIPTIGVAVNLSSSTLFVNWTVPRLSTIHGEFLGYILKYRERELGDETIKQIYIRDPTAKTYVIGHLQTYTQYWISLQVLNPEGLGPACSVFGMTDEGLPDKPLNLTVLEIRSREIELSWIEPDRPNGIITGYFVYYMYMNHTDVQTFKWAAGVYVVYNLTDLQPNAEYTIYVKAYTAKHLGNSSDAVISRTDIDGPSPPRIINLTCQVNDVIFVQWERPTHFFYTIDFYYIYVYISETYPYESITLPTNKDYLEMSYTFINVTTDTVYKVQVSASTYSKIYSEQLIYGNASELKEVYIQKKCEKRRRFLRYSTGELNVGMIAGLCCAAMAVLLVGSVLVIWRKCFRDSYYYLDDLPCSIPNNCLEWNAPPPSNSEHKGAITVEAFAAHVAELHADGDIGFSKEYEAIQVNKFNYPSEHSKSEENRAKNRYLNIIAYDHSRVHLLYMPGQKRNLDYINANYIDGFQRSRAYIGTQGPLPSTFDCFWRMVWEQRVTIIVMITNLVERGRVDKLDRVDHLDKVDNLNKVANVESIPIERKCDMYWPKEGTETYGIIQVRLVKEDVMATYTVRTLEIKHLRVKGKKIQPERIVYQYHYTNWPDHGTPDHPLPVLNFVKKSANANPANGGPIIVHCSAGVGRTGTYIVLDAMLKQIRTRGEVNIYGFLQHIRTQRNFLVQTEEQYIFIHDALIEAIQSGETNVHMDEMPNYIKSIQTNTTNNIKDQWKPLEVQFKLITSFQCQDFNLTSANKVINVPKNRSDIKPVESSRVHLTPKPGEDGSDYINATWLQGFNNLREFIVTPHPLRNTIKDFWQMIWDHNAQMIVMISTIDNQDFEIYWPMGDELLTTDSYKVGFVCENPYDNFITRDFTMHSLQDDYELNVRMVQYMDWPHTALVPDLMNLAGIVHEAKYGLQAGPVVVIDKFGGAEAAMFCCLATVKSQLIYEGHSDIYMFAKLYHNRRPGMWTLTENFLTMHTATEAYIASGDMYRTERRFILLTGTMINGVLHESPRMPPEGMEAVEPNLTAA